MSEPSWRIIGGELSLVEPRVMGILNRTPDSFSDGGELPEVDDALRRAEQMLEEGAAVLDVGGESTRPGAGEVPVEEELRRVIPVIEALARAFPAPISIDTRKARVAREAVAAGARIVNDVSGFTFDPAMPEAVASTGAGVVLMHMRGTPGDMRERAEYGDVVREVGAELGLVLRRAIDAGIAPDAIVLDPGLGFAKNGEQSLRILANLGPLAARGFPLLVGPSRKSFLGELLGVPPQERTAGTVAACVLAALQGARLFRVHDVGPVFQALKVVSAVQERRAA